MARHKLKPNLNIEEDMANLIERVAKYYGDPYDDRYGCTYDHVSLRQVAKEFNITVLKARKILITANRYSIRQSREVIGLYEQGESIDEIMSATGLSKSSVISYLPYQKVIYNMKNKSVGADRIERWRKKERNIAISDNL
jgi:hypothetical protein